MTPKTASFSDLISCSCVARNSCNVSLNRVWPKNRQLEIPLVIIARLAIAIWIQIVAKINIVIENDKCNMNNPEVSKSCVW